MIREDPVRPGLLYCGTERGVYVSFDDGAQWLPLQQNLPRTSVRDLQVHGADLVIATHGRGFWIMDDIALLRSLAEEPGQATRLLPPAPTYRLRSPGFTGTPMPKDEPRGNNPPLGAMIDYVLARAADTLTLTISDSRGSILRVFSARDPQAAPDLTKIEIAPDWISVPQSPSSSAGAHRFLWDLHASPPAELKPEDPTEQELGVWVPPGEYELDLAVDNVHYRQSLQVAPDPRVHVAPAAYARQFALARDIERSRVKLALALAEAATIHAQIIERSQHASPAAVATLAAADLKLLAISDLSPAKSSPDATGASPTTINGLRYLADAFHGLARAVDGADAAPTADAKSGYAADRALLERALKQWEEFKATELAHLNAQLTTTGIGAIDLKVPPR